MPALGKLFKKPLDFVSGEYGMAAVLLLLCILFSILTIEEKSPEGTKAGSGLTDDIFKLTEQDSVNFPKEIQVFIAAYSLAIQVYFCLHSEARHNTIDFRSSVGVACALTGY